VIVCVCVCCMCVTPRPSQTLPPSAGSCTCVYVHVYMCVCMRLCVHVCHTWNYAVLPIMFRLQDMCGRMIVSVYVYLWLCHKPIDAQICLHSAGAYMCVRLYQILLNVLVSMCECVCARTQAQVCVIPKTS